MVDAYSKDKRNSKIGYSQKVIKGSRMMVDADSKDKRKGQRQGTDRK